MNVLLDTHTLLWWLHDSRRLSPRAREILSSDASSLLWSVASSWEIAIKVSSGGLRLPEPAPEYVPRMLAAQGIQLLAIEHTHALRVAEMPPHHKDPFDRLIIAQAQVERLPVLTRDDEFRRYDVEVIW